MRTLLAAYVRQMSALRKLIAVISVVIHRCVTASMQQCVFHSVLSILYKRHARAAHYSSTNSASIRLYDTFSLLLATQEQEQVMRQLQASTKAAPTAAASSKQRAPSSSVPAGNARLFEKRTPLKRPGAGTASTAATTAGAAKQSVGKQRPGVGFGSSTARAVVQTIKPTPVRKSSASSTHSAISRPEGRARQQQQQQQLPQYAATDSSGNVAVVAGLSSGIQALLQRGGGGRTSGATAAPRMATHYSEYDDSGANDAAGELGGDSRFVQDDQLDKLMARTSSRAAASSSGRGGVREGAWRAEY
jgi:hypothetical protein